MQELKHERVKAGTTLAHCYWPLGQLVNEIKFLKGCLLVSRKTKVNLLSKTRSATEV